MTDYAAWSNIQFRFKVDASDFSLHPLKPEPDNGPNIDSIGGENMSFSDCEKRGYGYRSDMPRDIEMKCLFRFNDTSGVAHFKNISLREIDPTLSFDDTPTEPPPGEQPGSTTTVQGVFKLEWDINTYRTSACAGAGTGGGGGGGGTGNTVFYSVAANSEKELSDSSTYQHRTRVVEIVDSSSSPIKGKTIIQLDVPLKKNGSPGASPAVSAKIWDSSNAVVYTSPTTFDPSTFTTSFVTKTFDFATNTHAMVTGDRIGVEYTGTSSSNYVICGYDDDSIANSTYANYESGSYDSKPSRDFACDMWQ